MKECGLYLRVSTDEQVAMKEGSLKIQQTRLEAFVKARSTSVEKWQVNKVYSEEGVSGKNMHRPQLQALLDDLRDKKINVILCTKIDRITRSLLDFYYLCKVFKCYSADFICLDDSFDTSTAIGRMSLKMILIFAELEREQIGERTKKCLQTRANSGLWNSGPVLGYDIEKNRPGVLKVNEEEKKLVNLIFNTYLRTGSINKTLDYLNNSGFSTKSYIRKDGALHNGHIFCNNTIHRILTNKLYIGMIEINKSNKKKDQSVLELDQQYRYVKGKHESIIEDKLFSAAQEQISANFKKKKKIDPSLKHLYLLDGLLYCGLCNFPMKKSGE